MISDSVKADSEYSMLECYAPSGGRFTDILEYPLIEGVDSWMLGARFTVPLPDPLRLQWDPQTSGPRKTMYDATIPLLRHELIEALQQAGVDNLDCYPAVIVDSETGEECADYQAVNIIGLVSAADLGRSKFADPSGNRLIDMDFESLAIDADRTFGAKLFRLAECVSGVVIHRSVKEYLESLGGFGLSFVPPANWIG